MFALRKWIPAEEMGLYSRFALGFMVYITCWAILHDQIVIRIEPCHFTVYHRPLLDISNHTLLAIQYGFVATFGLGIVFGMVTYFVSRSGRLAKLTFNRVFKRFIALSLLVEAACLGMGYLEYRHYKSSGQHLIYPDFVFPDQTLGIAVTQTINISAYLLAGIGSLIFWIYLYQWRKKVHAAI